MNMFIVASIAVTVFWRMDAIAFQYSYTFNHIMDFIPPVVWFFAKTFLVIYIMMLFKWTFPRLRIDQLLTLEWKYLLPVNLFNILVVAFLTLMGWHF
jgi:NADH-quinone oxidoreductase subunit H